MASVDKQIINDLLKQLSRDIPELVRSLKLDGLPDIDAWSGVIDNKLLPRLQPDLPLLAAVCGGGSSGKSSLFNALVGDRVSPVGGRAGINRRVLLAADPSYFQQENILPAVFEPFGCMPEPLANPDDLTLPGGPLYVSTDTIPSNLAVMDTPDFDTGARGAYTNRQVARQALEASDIIIYIFTNSNYSNRDNTDFVTSMLTGIGLRKCFFIYRVYPSFQENEVLEHAMTVAKNIYGDEAVHHILGIYRADEDNRVAAGQRFMTLRPARPGDPSFAEALNAIDTRKLRLALNASIMNDTLGMAAEVTGRAVHSMAALRLYVDALLTAQSRCTHAALRHFPMDMVVRRFSDIWTSSDPSHIRFMRKTGSVLEWPVRVVAGVFRNAASGPDREAASPEGGGYTEMVKEDLIGAANELHMGLVGSEITVKLGAGDPVAGRMAEAIGRVKGGKSPAEMGTPRVEPESENGETNFVVPAHPAIYPEQERIRKQGWKSALQAILARKDVIITLSDTVEEELRELADGFRRRMGIWDKLRHSFSAFLNVIPATVAVTYILHTGDPVGAAGIKVKLTGLFGLKDLYALIAIPVTSGTKKVDRKQLELLLGPIARTWLNHKTRAVQQLLRQEITGGVLNAAEETLTDAKQLIERIDASLAQISGKEQRQENDL